MFMETINKRSIWIFFATLIVIMICAFILNVMYGSMAKRPLSNTNEPNGKYTTVKDPEGNVILTTGFPVHPQDEYISEKNIHYLINEVNADQAIASVINESTAAAPAQMVPFWDDNQALHAQATPRPIHVVIYHTHSDESYVPTSGTSAKPGEGDVYAVGSAFRETLKNTGISVAHSYDQHEPHDANAYHRSRRTAYQLLSQQPDAAFDIHRDSAPAESYKTIVNGQEISRVMIVVGRSNPYQSRNLAFAYEVKAIADELYPGLMRGIFMGKGDYNQDLYPTSLLFEIGTEDITLGEAQQGAICLADIVSLALGRL